MAKCHCSQDMAYALQRETGFTDQCLRMGFIIANILTDGIFKDLHVIHFVCLSPTPLFFNQGTSSARPRKKVCSAPFRVPAVSPLTPWLFTAGLLSLQERLPSPAICTAPESSQGLCLGQNDPNPTPFRFCFGMSLLSAPPFFF